MNRSRNLKAMAIDDEPIALRVIETHAQKISQLDLIQTTTNAVQGLQFALQHEVDIIFLDIQMPDLTGFQLLKQLSDKSKIVLTTAYPQYALQGYEHDVIDYLLKPISFDRFFQSFQKVLRLFQLKAPVSNGQEGLGPASTHGVIFIKTEHKLVRVNHDDVFYLQGGKDYTTIFTRTDKLLSLTSLTKFEEALPAPLFLRVHKSFLVAVNKIHFIERQRIFIENAVIPIGDSYKDAVIRNTGI
ncbi:response regulator transcription factor [Dyadobacter sp. LJ53]|uniref:LytR/AlgR family response regulator transcription factor n=1 Tax=Dyadobacter chenwenxiniae TaxID=2906456 RepID=UPI001F24752F|nr:response regulator transcription factor [Dyadobacter chenwenxiniae]MCF0051014.1 response regulator transcription factor [Dyadobacter chenwenxiniae]